MAPLKKWKPEEASGWFSRAEPSTGGYSWLRLSRGSTWQLCRRESVHHHARCGSIVLRPNIHHAFFPFSIRYRCRYSQSSRLVAASSILPGIAAPRNGKLSTASPPSLPEIRLLICCSSQGNQQSMPGGGPPGQGGKDDKDKKVRISLAINTTRLMLTSRE